ncbi:CRISPR-associated endonuclease Cas3'' [Leptospira kirschneri]|uniref:CRISPR-associated endonuclease Cas3'' n=1 Tax=Leptospira kirschneri TaxID=29507 RepID=UPI001E2D81EC|nr:CRISPR-associated endonuclease Cas3'' [Leptospira kirschneri]
MKNIRICPDNNVGSVQGKNPLIEAKTNNVHRFLQLWGKADRDESQNLIWHPLAYHMLDVAAVAWVWLQEGPNLKDLFLRISGLPEKEIILLASIACALHDVGKATVYFQNKIPEITRESGLRRGYLRF